MRVHTSPAVGQAIDWTSHCHRDRVFDVRNCINFISLAYLMDERSWLIVLKDSVVAIGVNHDIKGLRDG